MVHVPAAASLLTLLLDMHIGGCLFPIGAEHGLHSSAPAAGAVPRALVTLSHTGLVGSATPLNATVEVRDGGDGGPVDATVTVLDIPPSSTRSFTVPIPIRPSGLSVATVSLVDHNGARDASQTAVVTCHHYSHSHGAHEQALTQPPVLFPDRRPYATGEEQIDATSISDHIIAFIVVAASLPLAAVGVASGILWAKKRA